MGLCSAHSPMKIKIKRLSSGNRNNPLGPDLYQVVQGGSRSRTVGATMDAMDYSVNTSNRYGPLADEPVPPRGTLIVPKKPKPENFIIPRENITKLANIPEVVGLYNFQRQRNGDLKLIPKSIEAANTIKTKIDEHSLGYYFHPANMHKYVAYRLSAMDNTTLVNAINDCAGGRFKAADAKRMTIKNPMYPGEVNYLVYFETNPTLPVLQEVANDINGAVPSWSHYKNTNTRPSRCTNCQRPNHGSYGCRLPPKCVACAGDHKSSQCSLLAEKRNQNKERLPQEVLKCANCSGNHVASFSGCPYMQRKERPSSFRYNTWRKPTPAPQLNDVVAFPNLPPPQVNRPVNNISPPSQANSNANPNLFSLQELQSIMGEILTNLRNCQTREQQFNLMFNLAAKYVYGP